MAQCSYFLLGFLRLLFIFLVLLISNFFNSSLLVHFGLHFVIPRVVMRELGLLLFIAVVNKDFRSCFQFYTWLYEYTLGQSESWVLNISEINVFSIISEDGKDIQERSKGFILQEKYLKCVWKS